VRSRIEPEARFSKFPMNDVPSDENIVKQGTFHYDSCVECDICVVYCATRFGTGDYDDPPEIQNDMAIDSYYLWLGSTTERGRYSEGGGCFNSLAEAIANAEARPGFGHSIKWNK